MDLRRAARDRARPPGGRVLRRRRGLTGFSPQTATSTRVRSGADVSFARDRHLIAGNGAMGFILLIVLGGIAVAAASVVLFTGRKRQSRTRRHRRGLIDAARRYRLDVPPPAPGR